jgi:HTH-type transcriptional regulator / antitoxin HigA
VKVEVPDPVQAIEFAMEQRGLSRRDLEPYIGSRARVAEVLNHKRSLTLAMMRRLHAGLGIPEEVLIGGNGG